MDRIYRYLIIISAALLPLHLAAQNLDPTVEVSRAYEGKLVEVHKPSMDVSVPDTVQQFRLDFDYSVFDNPYKGSYEFNPYMASMRPSSAPFDQRTFYLRAGAGYRLQPVADVIWSPAFKKGFRMDVYARNRSYIGDYRNISLVPEGQSHLLGIQEIHGKDAISVLMSVQADVMNGRKVLLILTFHIWASMQRIHSRNAPTIL